MGDIKKQGLYNTVISYSGILIGFVSLIIIQPLFLTKEELGLTRILFSFSSLVATLMPLGAGSIVTKYFPVFKDEKTKNHGFFGLVLLFPLAGFAIFYLLLNIFKAEIISQYIAQSPLFTEYFNCIFPLTLFLGLITCFTVYSNSLFKSIFPTFLNDILIRVVSIVLFTVYFIKLISLSTFIYCFVGVYGSQFILLMFYIFKHDKPSIAIDWNFLNSIGFRKIFIYGFILTLASFSSLSLRYLDTIILGKFLPLTFVAVYGVAAFIPTVIEAPVMAFERIASPKIATAMTHNNFEEIKKIYYQSTKYFLIIGGLLFALVITNVSALLSFLPDYSSGSTVVIILAFSALFNMATGINTSIIFNSPNYRVGTFLLFLLLFFSITNNLLFIPRWGIEGAAVATSLSSFFYNGLKYLYIWWKFKLQPFTKDTLLTFGIITISVLLNFVVPKSLNPFLYIALNSVLVVVVYLVLIIKSNVIAELHNELFSKLKNPFHKK